MVGHRHTVQGPKSSFVEPYVSMRLQGRDWPKGCVLGRLMINLASKLQQCYTELPWKAGAGGHEKLAGETGSSGLQDCRVINLVDMKACCMCASESKLILEAVEPWQPAVYAKQNVPPDAQDEVAHAYLQDNHAW